MGHQLVCVDLLERGGHRGRFEVPLGDVGAFLLRNSFFGMICSISWHDARGIHPVWQLKGGDLWRDLIRFLVSRREK